MFGLLVTSAAAEPVGVREAEAAWWPLYGEVAPGAPDAFRALEWWLASFGATGSARVPVVQILLDAHHRGDPRTTEAAWLLAREPLFVLESDKGRRKVRRLADPGPPRTGAAEWVDVDEWYGQVGSVQGLVAGHEAPLRYTAGASALVGPATELFGLEGVVAAGVTAAVDGVGAEERAASLQGELLAGVGGDGVLLWLGAGYGSERRLHQLAMLEVTTDGDQPWPFFALRVELHEGLTTPDLGGRALLVIGAKLGETPD